MVMIYVRLKSLIFQLEPTADQTCHVGEKRE